MISALRVFRWQNPLDVMPASKSVFWGLFITNALLAIPQFIASNTFVVALMKTTTLDLVFVLCMYAVLRIYRVQNRFLSITNSLLLVAAMFGSGSIISYEFFLAFNASVMAHLFASIFYLAYFVFAAHVWRHGLSCGYLKGLFFTIIIEAVMIGVSYQMGWSMPGSC